MTRNTAREIAAHLSYELSFTDKTVEELLQERLTSEAFAELAEVYSNDPGSKSKGGDLGVFAPSQMVPEFGDAVLANEKGKVFTVDSRFGTHIAEVTYLSKPTKKVQLATITYRIEPSQTTQQAVYANASKFIAEAHGSYENFDKAVASNSLSKRVARIRNTDRNLNGIDNSREIVRWAFNGEKGDVSANGTTASEARDGLHDDGLENRRGNVLALGALVEQRLHIRLGEYAAARCDWIDDVVLLGHLI